MAYADWSSAPDRWTYFHSSSSVTLYMAKGYGTFYLEGTVCEGWCKSRSYSGTI